MSSTDEQKQKTSDKNPPKVFCFFVLYPNIRLFLGKLNFFTGRCNGFLGVFFFGGETSDMYKRYYENQDSSCCCERER